MEADVLDEWISVREAAFIAGTTKRCVNYWITHQRIKSRRVGNIWVVHKGSLAEIMEAGE